jgi:transcriptional regulator with XRE-family HTH domain
VRERAQVDVEDARTIGRRLRQIRKSRGKSLRVIAGLSGVLSAASLSRIENGLRALDRHSEVVALAAALEIAPSEPTRLSAPAPANGHTGSAMVEAVRHALMAADLGYPSGQVVPVEVLRARVAGVQRARRRARFGHVAGALPNLIGDLHTSIASGRDKADLLPLAALLHVDVVAHWLHDAGAPDLRMHAAGLARDAAHEHDQAATLAVAAWGTSVALLTGGMIDLAQAELDSITLPPANSETAGVLCGLAMTQSLVAAVDRRPADVHGPIEVAAELAARFGDVDDQFGILVGPDQVNMRRAALAMEEGDPERAVHIAEGVHPEEFSYVVRRAGYWIDYGRALARLRGRQDDAVRALLTAEKLFPARVYANQFVPDTLARLLARSRRDSPMGRELRGMAYRAGLAV